MKQSGDWSLSRCISGILFFHACPTLLGEKNKKLGMNALLMGVVAMIIGGVGSIRGIVLGSLLLAFAQNFGVWYISSQWQDAIAFGILLIFLLFKPEGFYGKKLRKAEV